MNHPIPTERSSIGTSFLLAATALALFGMIRFTFNTIGIRVFGATFVGEANIHLAAQTVIAVLLFTVPSALVSKFVAELIGGDRSEEAPQLFTAVVLLSCVAGAVVLVAEVWFVEPSNLGVLTLYMPSFGMYLLFKAAYFAFDQPRRYFRSELISSGLFFAGFACACAFKDASIARFTLLIQPVSFVLLGMLDHRDQLSRVSGASRIVRRPGRFALFAGSTFVNAIAGLASYHIAVLLAGWFLAERQTVGYLSVLLSALAPVNLLPTALGTVLFPELARRFGASDEAGQRTLVVNSVLSLQVFAIATLGAAMLKPLWLFSILGLPGEPSLTLVWRLMAFAAALSIVSSPCGHYLNATRFVHLQAAISAAFFLVGLFLGTATFGSLGIIAVGVMRLTVDGGTAGARMWLAQHQLRWASGVALHVMCGLAVLAGLLVLGTMRLQLWVACVVYAFALLSQIWTLGRTGSPTLEIVRRVVRGGPRGVTA